MQLETHACAHARTHAHVRAMVGYLKKSIIGEQSAWCYFYLQVTCANQTYLWTKHGLNLNGPVYANIMDKYRWNFIYGASAAGGVLGKILNWSDGIPGLGRRLLVQFLVWAKLLSVTVCWFRIVALTKGVWCFYSLLCVLSASHRMQFESDLVIEYEIGNDWMLLGNPWKIIWLLMTRTSEADRMRFVPGRQTLEGSVRGRPDMAFFYTPFVGPDVCVGYEADRT